MAAVGHVAVLALLPAPRRRARPPLLERVLEELAVQREAVRGELVAARAEFRAKECGRAREPIVRKCLARSSARQRPIAPRWSEELMPPHMAARADDALGLQLRVEIRVGHQPLAGANQRS